MYSSLKSCLNHRIYSMWTVSGQMPSFCSHLLFIYPCFQMLVSPLKAIFQKILLRSSWFCTNCSPSPEKGCWGSYSPAWKLILIESKSCHVLTWTETTKLWIKTNGYELSHWVASKGLESKQMRQILHNTSEGKQCKLNNIHWRIRQGLKNVFLILKSE